MEHNKSIEKQKQFYEKSRRNFKNLQKRRSDLAESKAKFEEMKTKLKLYKALVSGKITYLSKYFEDEIRKNKCVQEPKRTYFWKRMSENVHEIHKEGIIHADLKPSNFVLHECGLKLINIYKDGTSHNCNISYMAPELIKNSSEASQLDKVDIWSLGIILCQMTFGELPFKQLENKKLLQQDICDPMRGDWKFDIDSIEDDILRSLIKGCLMYNPADRYSIEQLLTHPYITKDEPRKSM